MQIIRPYIIYLAGGSVTQLQQRSRINIRSQHILQSTSRKICAKVLSEKSGITEPEEKGFIVEAYEYADFLQTIENSIGLTLVHEKEVTGEHQSVTYRYYQEESEEKENE